MIQILLSGCRGRMGRVITDMVQDDPTLRIAAGLDPSAGAPLPYPVFASPMEYTGTADGILDFSCPAALDDLLRYATAHRIPIVLATTGYSPAQLEQIQAAAAQIPIFRSANMSIGINVLIDLVRRAAAALEGYDIEIIERHHNQKVDAPSGTALMLANAAAEALPYQPEYVYDRSGRRARRDPREIGLSAVRGGTIVGEHTVLFAGHDEVIELHHSAQSRELFATGAIRAVKYLARVSQPGMYDMQRLLHDELD